MVAVLAVITPRATPRWRAAWRAPVEDIVGKILVDHLMERTADAKVVGVVGGDKSLCSATCSRIATPLMPSELNSRAESFALEKRQLCVTRASQARSTVVFVEQVSVRKEGRQLPVDDPNRICRLDGALIERWSVAGAAW